MRAVTVEPGHKDSIEITEVPEPPAADGAVLVETQAIGICGTDVEIIGGDYGAAPETDHRLIIGHESLGRVVDAPVDSGLREGDPVVGIVRTPDPMPCPACAVGQWDMCTNGQFTERGINGRHGFASERFRIPPEHVIKVDPSLGDLAVLVEPTTVVAKAWDHIEQIGGRASWHPHKVLVVGAGPIGILAALLSVQRGFDTHVFDRATQGPKPAVVAALGATYHEAELADAALDADIVIECTGAAQLLFDSRIRAVPNRITCLTGVSSSGTAWSIDPGFLNRRMVLNNGVLFGSVNANRSHYELAGRALADADRTWLSRLITRRVPLAHWSEAYVRQPDDIKTVLRFGS